MKTVDMGCFVPDSCVHKPQLVLQVVTVVLNTTPVYLERCGVTLSKALLKVDVVFARLLLPCHDSPRIPTLDRKSVV